MLHKDLRHLYIPTSFNFGAVDAVVVPLNDAKALRTKFILASLTTQSTCRRLQGARARTIHLQRPYGSGSKHTRMTT